MASEGKRIIIQQGKTKTEKYAFLMPFSASGFTALLCFGCLFFCWGGGGGLNMTITKLYCGHAKR